MTLFRYSVRTLGGERAVIEAHDPDEALRLLGLTRDQVRRWYPFALSVVPDPEEQAKRQAALDAVRSNPIYQQNAKRKRDLKRRVRAHGKGET